MIQSEGWKGDVSNEGSSPDGHSSQLMTSRFLPRGHPGWLFQYLNASRSVVNSHCLKPLTTRTSLTSDQGTSRSLPQPKASLL